MQGHRTIIILILLLCVLCLPPSAALSVSAAAFPGTGADAFRYEHDPRLNPKAMKDIIVDPAAVYGFAPSPDGSLSAYVGYDWSDPAVVNGENGRMARIAYHESINEMYTMIDAMQMEGKSLEDIARAVSAKRNEIRMASYVDDPEGLAAAKARNLEKYGHEEGPDADALYEQYGSWETVLEKAFSANAGMDACLGLYDDYYELYVMLGQVEDEHTAAASREYAIAAFIDAAGIALPKDAGALSSFKDGQTVSPYYAAELAAAVDQGILRGYDDKTLKPLESISRVEALVILSRCLPDLKQSGQPLVFTDVPAWAKEDMDRLSGAGLVLDYGDGLLGAADNLTVEQVRTLTGHIAAAEAGPLSLWTGTARAKRELTAYVSAVTDPAGRDDIPVTDRIAVFDLDGTLFCETDPNYFDCTLLKYSPSALAGLFCPG